MAKIKVNSLVEFDVEQIKVSGIMYVGGKKVNAGVNKTLDSSYVSRLPTDLVQILTLQAFGSDYTSLELTNLISNLEVIAEEKKATEVEEVIPEPEIELEPDFVEEVQDEPIID